MNITKTLYIKNRAKWREWLAKHHATEPEIWLIYYKKHSDKPRLSYNDAVEEALCFGWIDSTVKGIDEAKYAQRFSPRKKSSQWSEMNKERVRRLIKLGKMTPAGLKYFEKGKAKLLGEKDVFTIAADILQALKGDNKVWRYFQKFPLSYRRIRISWIDGARKRPAEFQKRLNYFVNQTRQNKKFGIIQ